MPYSILSGDPRAVFTGNPPADMNNVNDVLSGMGGTFNVLNTAFNNGADPTGVGDSTGAFQACINAATGTASQLSGEVIIPPGNYTLNAASIPLTGPVRMRGLGSAAVSGPGITAKPAVTLNCNGGPTGTHHMFTFPFQGYLWGGLEVANIAINYTGTGNVYDTININGAVWRDCQTTVTSSSAMALNTAGNVSFINITHERCFFFSTAAVRTNPLISVASSIPQGVSESTFFRCGFYNNGLDNTQYLVYFAVTSPGNGYHAVDNFIDCYFEHPFGGAIKSLSGQSIKIDGCVIWDIFPSLGQSVGNSLFYFGAYPGNNGSMGVRLVGCERSLNATNLDGVHTWDVECESTTSQVYIEGFTTNPASASTQTNAFFNFHGCNDVVLVNNVSPRGSTINGNSTTVVTNPSPTQVVVTQGTIAGSVVQNTWQPLDMGYIAWAFDASQTGMVNTRTVALGTLNLIGCWIRTGAQTVANVDLWLGTNGSVLTSGQNLVGLYSSTGSLLGFSPDQTAAWGSGAPKRVTVTLTQQSAGSLANLSGLVWIAILANGTTAPAMGSGSNSSATIANGIISVSTARYATNGAGLTSLPTSITPGSNVLSQIAWWGAIY